MDESRHLERLSLTVGLMPRTRLTLDLPNQGTNTLYDWLLWSTGDHRIESWRGQIGVES